jgi:hypothetical protein
MPKITRKIFEMVLLILVITRVAYAQETSFVEKKEFDAEIKKLEDKITSLKRENVGLRNKVIEQSKNIGALQGLMEKKEENIKKNVIELKQETQKTQSQLHGINETISVRTILWVIITAGILLLCCAIYLILRRKFVLNTKTLDQRISKTGEALESEAVKLVSKLTEVLETQLRLENEKSQSKRSEEPEIDHSLALRVGEEIFRMRRRIENMPDDTKGLGALKNAITRLEEEFNTKGYEIIDLTGKAYNDGMTVNARFISSDELKSGENIITKVIKPQINYKGVLKRAAEIEVSTGG